MVIILIRVILLRLRLPPIRRHDDARHHTMVGYFLAQSHKRAVVFIDREESFFTHSFELRNNI